MLAAKMKQVLGYCVFDRRRKCEMRRRDRCNECYLKPEQAWLVRVDR